MKKYLIQLVRVWKDSGVEIIEYDVKYVERTEKEIDKLNRELSEDNAIECYKLRRQPKPKQQMFSSGPN